MSDTDKSARGDRPSQHGAQLGAVLAKMAQIGRDTLPDLPETCLTCAFKEGTAPNQSAGTALIAFKCAMSTDPDPFGCHHGMQDGRPTKLCAGYFAAHHAVKTSYDQIRELVASWALASEDEREDTVRAKYDAWLSKVDPLGTMDVYQAARMWAAHAPNTQPTASKREGEHSG